jgi:SNF2 family DNA or RNA helicase
LAVLQRVLQPPDSLLLDPSGPLNWPHSFFNYQYAGIKALLQSDGILLGDEMGLGKTVQVIAACRILAHQRKLDRALIVVPASLTEQWMRAVNTWAPELNSIAILGPGGEREWGWKCSAHFTIASYEIVRADLRHITAKWDVVILDEAQKIKNRDTGVAASCKKLVRTRSWAVTGTPLENRLEDISSILQFVVNRKSSIVSRERIDSLLLQTLVRRRKRDVLKDLPPKIVTEIPLELSDKQRETYDRIINLGLVKLRAQAEVTVANILELILRLKQICNFDPESGSSSKLSDIKDRLEATIATGHKALIFSQFSDDFAGVKRIADGLRKYHPLTYTGTLDERERKAVLSKFDEEEQSPVLILSLRAGGAGLNLQNASYVFHFDRWWNPAVETQAEDRVHRIGQTESVFVYKYISINTIEQKIDDLIKEKGELFNDVIDRHADLPISRLAKEDLLRILAP